MISKILEVNFSFCHYYFQMFRNCLMFITAHSTYRVVHQKLKTNAYSKADLNMMLEIQMISVYESSIMYTYLFIICTNFEESSLFMSIWGVRRLLLALQRSVNCNQSKWHLCPTFQIFGRESDRKLKRIWRKMNKMTYTLAQKCWHPHRSDWTSNY